MIEVSSRTFSPLYNSNMFSYPVGTSPLFLRRGNVQPRRLKVNFSAIIPPTIPYTDATNHGHLKTNALDSPRSYATSQPEKPSVQDTLRQLGELSSRVSAENSRLKKQAIIAEYPDLRELLEYIYSPDHRTHMTSASLKKYLDPRTTSCMPDQTFPSTLIGLFDLLSSKRVTGNQAKETVRAFLVGHGLWKNTEMTDTFERLLDRNLVAGFGAKTLTEVDWGSSTTPAPVSPDPHSRESTNPASSISSATTVPTPKPETKTTFKSTDSLQKTAPEGITTPILPNFKSLDKFNVSLGKSIEPPFDKLFTDGSSWYASRKLDGVRVLTFLDFYVPHDNDQSIKLVNVHFVSRSGKPFFSLGKLQEQLKRLEQFPLLGQWLASDRMDIPGETGAEIEGGKVKRLVLDGEVCLMRPRTDEELARGAVQPRDDGSVPIPGNGQPTEDKANEMWVSAAQDPFVEDFNGTVSAVRRTDTIEHLSYFVFDALPWAEVWAKQGLTSSPGLGKTFGQRIADMRALGDWFREVLEREGVKKEDRMIKDLIQVEVKKPVDVECMVERAVREGWEGLILRKNKLYKGKRSPDVRKFKKWQDAEYVVESIETNTMRLAIRGEFANRLAMANIWIKHKGHPVSVGSGFTAEQRLKYAENEGDIVGKTVTVEYFEESGVEGREGKSLRFPRVKAVWDTMRDV